LNKQAFDYLDLRDEEISKLKTKTDWMKRQQKVKDILMKIVGPFPEKTPLNARVTGVVKKDEYRIEKIIYESIPNFYVTGCLFIPDGIKGKRPAILKLIGHTPISFRVKGWYQEVIKNLVKKGFIVFAIDPIGQGERVQYYNPHTKKSVIGYSVIEHNYFGYQCFLSGTSSAKYFIWDGIRAIDYLLTREEVDSERIGVTGLSGGGAISSYICAFDERIRAAAPMNWHAASRRLIESSGASDADGNFYNQIVNGITFEDLLELRAPKPTLMVFTTRDYLNIQGAREAYKEIKRAYKAFGMEENLQLSEDDDVHAFTRKNNEATYAFFQKYLNLPGDPTELELEALTPEELNITPTGQVSTYLGGENVSTLNIKDSEKLVKKIEKSRKNIDEHLGNIKVRAKEISGYATPLCNSEPVFCGRYQREGYNIEMYVIEGEKDYVIPLLLFVPEGNNKYPGIIYIHPEGKSKNASPGSEIEKIVKKGYIVAAPDLLGIGETKSNLRPTGDDKLCVLTGRSIVGIHAGDIVRVVNFLKIRKNVDKEKINAVAIDEMCPALIHAAAFDASINNIALLGSIISYRSIVMNEFYKVDYYSAVVGREDYTKWYGNKLRKVNTSCTVPGAITAYDLPDLIGCIAPRKVFLAGLKNQMLEPASEKLLKQELLFPRSVYSYKSAEKNLKIQSAFKNLDSVINWCFE
ncbi:alpha/beta hydrolase family protein, partial [candidate division KSB1 bacterium]